MIIYIALIKSKDEKQPTRLVLNNDEKEFKARLATVPKVMIETIASYDMQSNTSCYYSVDKYLA